LEKFKQNPIVKKLGFNRIILMGVLILLYLIFCAVVKDFAGSSHLMGTLNYVYFLGFLSLGVTFVIATGGIDFSIGPVMFCCALISGYCFGTYHFPMWLALILCIFVGFLFGLFNGYLVAYWSVPPFIVSMASMNIAKGVASVFTKTQSVSWPRNTDAGGWFRNLAKAGPVPTGLIIFLIAAAICSVVLNNTKAGRYILCLGSNKEAVRLSGVNIKKWEMLSYIICGILVRQNLALTIPHRARTVNLISLTRSTC
jgi:ribose transport system permease protein